MMIERLGFFNLLKEMKNDMEHGSKYHLEGSVYNHTKLVVQQGYDLTEKLNIPQLSQNYVKLLTFYHDIAKPLFKQYNEKSKRYIYTGHWYGSGNVFLYHFEKYNLLKETLNDKRIVYILARLIQLHHVEQFKKELRESLKSLTDTEKLYLLILKLSDLRGRIVDDTVKEKFQNEIEKYENELYRLLENIDIEEIDNYFINSDYQWFNADIFDDVIKNTQNIILIPIGLPKSGKTTTYRKITQLLNGEFKTLRLGLDDIRVQLYYNNPNKTIEDINDTETYQKIHEFSTEQFGKVKNELYRQYAKFIKENNTHKKLIQVDNTNLIAKYRMETIRWFKNMLRNQKTKIIGLLFTTDLEEILYRRTQRYDLHTDRKENERIIINMWLNRQLPLREEGFDKIFLVP
jgi:hypothetical protein